MKRTSSAQLRQNRRRLLDDLETVLQTYCEGCLLFQHFKSEKGRRFAHHFCIRHCTVGERIKEIGKRLSEEE